MRRPRLVFFAIVGALAALAACGNGAIGVDDCRTIEDALCQRADALGCSPMNDLPPSTDSLSACTRFYSIACLHGLETTATYTKEQVTTCVDAINAIKTPRLCSVIESPQTAPDAACAWLIPPEAGADAGDAATADAATDASADGSDGSDGD